jgi:hypothetical protein
MSPTRNSILIQSGPHREKPERAMKNIVVDIAVSVAATLIMSVIVGVTAYILLNLIP